MLLSIESSSKIRISRSSGSSVHQVFADDDLLIEILLRLPVRSLLRFKSVSKRWLSLITNPYFSRRKSTHITPVSGLFLPLYSNLINPQYRFIPLGNQTLTKPPFKALTFVNDPLGIRILQSCNGLLCCGSSRGLNDKSNFYIYNPTTKQFTTLPDPRGRIFRFSHGVQSVCSVNLAFDPSKSPHYKVLCVYFSDSAPELCEIEIYSSENGRWRHFGDPFSVDFAVYFKLGVFWNGAINWYSVLGDSLYFNVEEERLGTMPMPPLLDGWGERRVRYFGESREHLLLIEIYGPNTAQFNVYEMERDYSGWLVKYRVDLEPVMNSFPEAISAYLDPGSLHYYEFCILSVVRGEKDEDSFIVLNIPGKVIRYNFRNKNFFKLCDLAESSSVFRWFHAFGYFESLSCV